MKTFFRGIFPALMLALCGNAAETFDLDGFIRRAYRQGEREITLPDGDIRFSNTVVLDAGVDRLTIRGGRQTRLILTRCVPFFSFTGARNVKISDLTFDLEPQPITQGTITEAEGTKIRFKLHDGYPRLETKFLVPHPQFFDRDTRLYKWNHSTTGIWSTSIRALNDSEGEITFNAPFPGLRPGDYVALNTRIAESIKIRARSGNLTFENLTFHATSGYGIMGRRTDGYLHIRRCRIVRDPRPPRGATEPRLMASGADAFNFASCRQGPVIEECEVEAIGDDSINLHGEPFPILRVEGKSVWFCAAWKTPDYLTLIHPGDTARLLAPGNFAVSDTARIVKIETAPATEVDRKALYPAGTPPEVYFFRAELDREWQTPPGSHLDVPAIQAPNFIIRNNYFHNHRARGIRSQASGGIIENNRIEHLEAPAITVGPEYLYWNEGGWVDHVTIRGNRIRDVALGINYPHTYTLGAICTFARIMPGGKPFAGNRNVVIENNDISGTPVAGIAMAYTRNSIIRNNRISNACTPAGTQAGGAFELPPPVKPIEVVFSESIEQSENEVISE